MNLQNLNMWPWPNSGLASAPHLPSLPINEQVGYTWAAQSGITINFHNIILILSLTTTHTGAQVRVT